MQHSFTNVLSNTLDMSDVLFLIMVFSTTGDCET